MGVVPPEWRSLIGYPALTGQCCMSIISRTSSGPAVSGFNPDQVGVTAPVPSKLLIGYPNGTSLGPGWNTTNPLFNGGTVMGGVAFPSGTRTILFLGRHGTGPFCYGTGGSSGGVCYDPTSNNQGSHSFPYVWQIWAYDANDVLAVIAGTKQPWEVQPYGVWPVPGLEGAAGYARVRGAVYDDATRRLYVTKEYFDQPRVHVLQIGTPTTPPPPVPCEGTWAETVTLIPAVCDATQVQTRTATRTFTQTSGDVGSCPASPVVTTTTEACVYVPPTPPDPTGEIVIKSVRPKSCDIRVTSTPPDATGGWGVQFTLNGSNMGSRDTSDPYQRDKSNVVTGTIAAGVWSKSADVRPFTIGPVVCE
jgi:hypothetical protein